MPWMVCKCDRRFYALPSQMAEATCEECQKAPDPAPAPKDQGEGGET